MVWSVTQDCIVSADWTIVNNELERMCKEVVMAQFKVLSWDLAAWIEENHENPQSEQSMSWSGFKPDTSCTWIRSVTP
jgi:hypothetical protein